MARKKKARKGDFSEGGRPLDLDGMPSNDIEAEQALLGAMLLEPPVAIPRVLAILGEKTEDAFYVPGHQAIWRAIHELFHGGEPVDTVTLSARMRRHNTLEMVGGQAYLVEVEGKAPTAASVKGYIEAVRRCQNERLQVVAINSFRQQADTERREALMRALQDGYESPLEIVSVEELMKEDLQTDWLVPGLIPRPGVTVVAGDPGMGKSWAGLALADAVTGGLRWLGQFTTERGGAVYVDAEGDRGVTVPRLDEIWTARGHKLVRPGAWDDDEEKPLVLPAGAENFSFVFFPPFHLGPGVGMLEAELRARHAKLLVLDSLSALLPADVDENSNAEMTPVMNALDIFSRKLDISIVLMHHNRKGQAGMIESTPLHKVRGAGVITARAVSVFVVNKAKERSRFIWEQPKLRHAPETRPFIIEVGAGERGGTEVRFLDWFEQEIGKQMTEVMDLIYETLRENAGPMQRSAIEEAVLAEVDCTKRHIGNAIRGLLNKDRITKVSRGVYDLKGNG